MGKVIDMQLSFNDFYDDDFPVVQAQFLDSCYMNANDVFDGFDDLKVITFSYSLDFIEKISKKFKTMSVILGCDAIVTEDAFSLVLATQQKVVEGIKKHEGLRTRAIEGNVKFKVSHEVMSHQKIYIMTTEDGSRSRVVTGSPNFSKNAFGGYGTQRETFTIFDDQIDALEFFQSIYFDLEDLCTDEVPIKSLYLKDTDAVGVEDLPVVSKVKEEKIGVIVEESKDKQKTNFITDVMKMQSKYADMCKQANIRIDKKAGHTVFSPDKIVPLMRAEKKQKEAEDQRLQVYPKLHIDYEAEEVSFNGKRLELKDISEDEIKSDIDAVLEYFAGFDMFFGDSEQAKNIYYKMLIFMFASPFMAKLRLVADEYGFAVQSFPYFAILHGQKSAGKTQFVRTVQHLMTGADIKIAEPNIFTQKRMKASLSETEGIPVCIDEMANQYFKNNSTNVIKCDRWLLDNNIDHHGTYIITTNEIETIGPDLAKRIYYASVPITLDNTTAVEKTKPLSSTTRKMSTALYRVFLAQALPLVNDMIYKMQTFDVAKDEEWCPDIFDLASKVFLSLMKTYHPDIPAWMTPLVYGDYFGYNNIVINAREFFKEEWTHNKDSFKIFRQKNQLEYDAGEHKYDATNICNQLPEVLEAKQHQTKVIMKLDEAEKFFGITFRRGLFS